MLSFSRKHLNNFIGKNLPSSSRVRSWEMRTYSEHTVKEEHSLFCPRRQILLGFSRPNITQYFFKYVFDTWWYLCSSRNRERHTRSDTRGMIRILTKNYHLDRIKMRDIKCPKNIFLPRKTYLVSVLIWEKRDQLMPIRFLKLSSEILVPRSMDF